MSTTKLLTRSFAGGEITPELFGRLDLTKFQTGLGLAQNFFLLPHGPAARRPGFEYILEARDSTQPVRLIPFEYSADQTVMIEFGELYVRFHLPTGTLLETGRVITGITQANPGVVTSAAHGFVNNDWVFLQGIAGMTPLNGAYFIVANVTANTFTLRRLDGIAVNTTAMPAYSSGGTAARVYTVVSPFAAADLFGIHYAQSADVLTLVHPSYAARELRRSGATSWVFTTISFAPTLAAPGGVTCVATKPSPTNVTAQHYKVTAVGVDGVTESLASANATDTNNLTIAGNFNTISWSAVTGASRYKAYKQRGGSYGYIGQTTTLSVVDDNILADTSLVPPEDIITLNGSVGNYPSAVTYHEQRRWFGGTNNKPQSIFATRNGTESNLTASIPSQDADGLEFRVAAKQQNRVRHLVPLSDMVALTSGGEWRIFADNAPAITPTSLSVKPTGYAGASDVQPVVTSGSVLYVQAQGSRVRELSYGGAESNYNFRTIDLAIMAPHLFNTYTIKELAFVRAPDQSMWAVRSDGRLLGCTYVPEQQVYAWHQHVTDGLFESCAVISQNNEDALWVVVKRTINGRSVRYVERLRTRVYGAKENAFFVDSGLTYSGAATLTVGNLHHLEGKTVSILADGAVEPAAVVTGGSISVPVAASKINVGLPVTADLRTLPLAMEGTAASGQGTVKNVNKVHIRVAASLVVKAGPSFNKLTEFPARNVSDPYALPPAEFTGELSLSITPSWNTDGAVCVRQDAPLPLTVLSMTFEVAVGG